MLDRRQQSDGSGSADQIHMTEASFTFCHVNWQSVNCINQVL